MITSSDIEMTMTRHVTPLNMSLDQLVPDVIQLITDQLDCLSQVHLRQVCRYTAIHCRLTNLLLYGDTCLPITITDQVLRQCPWTLQLRLQHYELRHRSPWSNI